jgi:hypothetical protein
MPGVSFERVGAHVVERVLLGKQVGAERGEVVKVQIGRGQMHRFEQQPQRLVLIFAIKGRSGLPEQVARRVNATRLSRRVPVGLPIAMPTRTGD